MGYYVQVKGFHNKASQIVKEFDGVCTQADKFKSFDDIPKGKSLIVVVDNGPFEAAGIVYDAGDFAGFVTRYINGDDKRVHDFVLVDTHKIAHFLPESLTKGMILDTTA